MSQTVFSRFYAIANARPGHLAVISDEQTLTYQALLQRAAAVSAAIRTWYLDKRARPVGAADVIGIQIGKCADLYAAMLGVMATGASYVPLDPLLPTEEQQYVAGRCGCELVLSLDEVGQLPPSCEGMAIRPYQPAMEPGAELAACTLQTDLCYTIFTSGSTGKPKGVGVTHANLLNLVDWAVAAFGMGPHSRVLQYSTINFDASVLDIFPALLSGATLCVPSAQQRMSATGLAELCCRHGVDQAFLPPSLLSVLEPAAFEGVVTLLTGGEPCSPQVVQAWSAGRRFYNLYGPTECTVLATCKRMEASTDPRNLGRAISGARLHVLDEDGRPAARGELHIGGLGVAPGYVGDATTTAARFIRIDALDASVLYKTGDIVEADSAGDLHFVGRKDRQVKVRGYRVELEEIEGVLQTAGCRQAAVVLMGDGALAAYVSADEAINPMALKARLSQRLSPFKIPQHVVQLPALPLKPNGKVDHGQLPANLIDQAKGAHATGQASLDHCYAPIAGLWARTLSIDVATLSPSSNFRDLGGTSIHIVRLLGEVEDRFGVTIPFIEFFNNPTLQFIYQSLQRHEEPSCCQP